MSLEHEMAEISTLYHGQRARMEELVQLIRDASGLLARFHDVIEHTEGLMYAVRAPLLPEIDAWQRRAHTLTGGPGDPGT